jgi:hypothetical protein
MRARQDEFPLLAEFHRAGRSHWNRAAGQTWAKLADPNVNAAPQPKPLLDPQKLEAMKALIAQGGQPSMS